MPGCYEDLDQTDLQLPLAGGSDAILFNGLLVHLARRGGIDKSFISLAGRPLLAQVIDRTTPQVNEIILSTNADRHRFAAFGLENRDRLTTVSAAPSAR